MELILLIGLQASGKSTFYQTHFADTHSHVSKDLLRNNSRPARRQLQLIEEALAAQRSVVVDNTNPTPEDRTPLIELGHRYGAQVVGYYFAAQVKESLERNKQREGKARVPDIAIFATLKRLTRPMYTEGFDTLFCVQTLGDGEFEVVDWQEEEKAHE